MVKHREVIHNEFLKQKFFLIILTLEKELTVHSGFHIVFDSYVSLPK